MKVKVLGSGCHRCVNFADEVDKAIGKLDKGLRAERVFDLDEVKKFNLQKTPALVVNDEVVVSGESLNAEKIYELLVFHKTS